jgi:hypothetical protein
VSGSVLRVCSRAHFIGQKGRAQGWQAWAPHGGHRRAPVATVVFTVWESSAGVLAMLGACWCVGDDGNEREQWRHAGVTGDDVSFPTPS